ncbi:Electroneutral sodium bicarbonate exchanger 1 [Seminavis robusta]|uniref:Electroneutral sodium bicarbonate exchanger 1 n=1 Tax=Seminavis robusta TaxID=568900 RepID=A0A9N8HUG8_9STRA|nr:Electroneutral sodium bicarbonate exchanger 1 [Seminavis robusta]|eukprot:Sro1381_g267900.1 Electroneutral sodium bicarbonate exchanger 1 (609) ;mRNA; r:27166-29047
MRTPVEYKAADHPERPTHPTNEEIDPNAGKVALAPAQPWGTGILGDIKRTVGTHWFAEMTNFNQKTIAVSCLIFISIIPPTLAFGASYGKMSNQKMGAIETILATSWIGIAYSLIGGMPMCIIGSTGPALAISTAIKNIAEGAGIEYINWNAWISIWLFGYCFAAGFFDLTRYVRLATRFTDEIFALLIVAIFVMDAVGDPFSPSGILRYLDPNHRSHGEYEDEVDYEYLTVGFLSVILGFGTTALIFFFRSFKFSSFFCNDMIRTSVHDFAVTMSVVFWTLIKELLFPEVQTEGLQVPDKFEPSFQCCTEACDTFWPDECPEQEDSVGARSWFVDLGGVPSWAPFAAAGPAIMAFLLCYLDNGITWHLINHKHHKLTHGEAYNYDLCLNGLFNCVNGLMGLPWMLMRIPQCPGNSFDHVLLSSFLGIDYGCLECSEAPPSSCPLWSVPLHGSVFFAWYSVLEPFPPLLQPPSRYPETVFLKYMESKRVHMYTVFQMCFFAGIFVVMNVKAISIAFPFMTFLCIPSRLFFLPRFFAGWELTLLDGEEDSIEEWVQLKQDSIRSFNLQQDQSGKFDDDSDSMGTSEPMTADVPVASVAEARFLSDDISV